MIWDSMIRAGQIAGALTGILAAVTALLYKPIIRPWRSRRQKEAAETKAFREATTKTLSLISGKVDHLAREVADVERDRLSQLHGYYVRRGYCTAAEKHDYGEWFRRYSERGNNHVHRKFLGDVLDLPEEPGRWPSGK